MRHVKFSIQNKLLFSVFFISAAITALFITISLVFDYYQEKEDLESSIYFIERNNLEPISKLLWDYNEGQLMTQVQSLSSLPQVVKVSLKSNDSDFKFEANHPTALSDPSKNIIKSYNLSYGESKEKVGQLQIEYNRNHIFQKLYDKLLFIVVTQVLKSLLITTVLYLTFKALVTQRLLKIFNFVEELNANKFEKIESRKFFPKDSNYQHSFLSDEITLIKKVILKMAYRTRKYNEIARTQIKSAMDEVEQQKAMAVQANKLAAIGELAASVAHEINNPLSVIQSRAELMKKMRSDVSENQRFNFDKNTEALEKMTIRINKIVKSLLGFSRSGAGEDFSIVRIQEIMSDMQMLSFEKARKKNIQIEIDCPDIELQCRPIQLSQVLTNLINNSIDAIEHTENPWIKIKCYLSDSSSISYFNLVVSDSGHGIDKEVQKKLMQPFFTTKARGKGVGIGLNISKNIIREHGGQLALDDQSINTTFHLRFPQYQPLQMKVTG